MKPTTLATALLTSGLFLTTSQAQLIPFFTNNAPSRRKAEIQQQQQNPMAGSENNAPNIQLPQPPSSDNDNDNTPPQGSIILSDVIQTQSSINIFASFTRDISSVSTRLETSTLNTTVLAPLNSAITSLPRKPWEDPREYAALGANAYAGSDGEDRAHANLRRFTEAHVVPASPWKEGERVESLGGGKVWWEMKEGKMVVQPGGVEIERVAGRVANGEVWVLRGCLNYAS